MRSFSELLQSPRALRGLVAGGGALGLLLLGLLSAPVWVRAKVSSAASERGLEAEVDSVRLGWSGIWLRGVRVTSPGQDVELRLDQVNVGVFSGAVKASGGSLRGSGDPEPVLRKLRGKSTGGAEGGDARGRELSLEGLFVSWQRDGSETQAFGVRAARSGRDLSLGADLARVSTGKWSVEARGLAAAATNEPARRQLSRLATSSIQLIWRGDAAVRPGAPPDGPGAPRGPPGDVPAEGDRRAEKLRELRAVLVPLLREGLASDAQLALSGVSARIERAGEVLSFGPSRLALQRDADAVLISLLPSAVEAGVTPLALDARLPLAGGPLHVVAKGGPVSLASLGVQRGQLGLRDVRQALLGADGSAEFSEDFESVALDGKLSMRGIVLERRELSPEPVGPWGFELTLKARANLDGSALSVSSAEAHVGELRVELSGEFAGRGEQRSLKGRLRVPLSGCQTVLSAMPRGLLPLVQDLRLSGSFGVDLQVGYDTQAPKATAATLNVQNECRVVGAPAELSPQRFERPFLREVKAADGSAVTVETGPGTASWVSLDDMSRHLETAVLICEDSRFHSHAGFDFRALADAIKDDLKVGRFARGASTLSMQLAKNLYLGQEKTLGRKLQEAWLTLLLEQQLDKRRILELYLNVVELGPGLYGVGEAAQYYFATPARALTLGQALYLASILPNPTYSRFGPDGKLSPRWLDYLRRLMHIAHKIKRIDDAELEAGLAEQIAFREPGSGALPMQPEMGAEPEPPLESEPSEP